MTENRRFTFYVLRFTFYVRFVSRTFLVFYDSFPLIWEFVVEPCRSGLTREDARSCPLRKGRVKWPTSRPQRPLLFSYGVFGN